MTTYERKQKAPPVDLGNGRGRTPPLGRIAQGLIVALLVFAPLAIGTVHPWSRAIVFIGSAAALGLMVAERHLSGKPFRLTFPALPLSLAVVLCAIQLVPLPASVIAAVSPRAHELLQTTLGDYRFHSLTLDVAATLHELGKLTAYLVFFLAASTWASRSSGQKKLVLAIALTAITVAAIGLLQTALGSPKILFVYSPIAHWGAAVRGSFVNPNHFGALMCLGAPCALSLALAGGRTRQLMVLGLIVLNSAALLSQSRSGIIATLAGQIFVLGIHYANRPRANQGSPRRTWPVGLLAAGAVAVAVTMTMVLSPSDVVKPHSTSAIERAVGKTQVWRQSLELIEHYPITGVGRGAFEFAFTQFNDRGGSTRNEWVENGYLQALTDWGALGGAVILLLCGYGGWLALRSKARSPYSRAAVAGVMALALHECFDFAVEVPGVALSALALLAILFAPGKKTDDHRRIATGWMAVPALVLIALTVVGTQTTTAAVAAARLATVVRDPATHTEAALRQGQAARAQHPAHYLIHALVAERLARDRHAETMAWLNDAMYLNPTDPDLHVMAAEILASLGRKDQALLEYRAASSHAFYPHLVWTRVIRRYPSLEDLLAATPESPRIRRQLAKWLGGRGRLADSEEVYEAVKRADPGDVQVLQRLAEIAINAGELPVANERMATLLRIDHSRTTRKLLIRLRLGEGKHLIAGQLLDTETTDRASFHDLAVALVDALATAGDLDGARQRLIAIGQQRGLKRGHRAQLHETRAKIEQLAGNRHQSLWELEEAKRLRGQD